MKTEFEKMFVSLSKPYKKKVEQAQREYQQFLKSFIQNTLTGKAKFKLAYEEGLDSYHDYLFMDGGIPRQLYPKHEVMEHFIQTQIYYFDDLKAEDPIKNRNL